jgi:hypothetical protein
MKDQDTLMERLARHKAAENPCAVGRGGGETAPTEGTSPERHVEQSPVLAQPESNQPEPIPALPVTPILAEPKAELDSSMAGPEPAGQHVPPRSSGWVGWVMAFALLFFGFWLFTTVVAHRQPKPNAKALPKIIPTPGQSAPASPSVKSAPTTRWESKVKSGQRG